MLDIKTFVLSDYVFNLCINIFSYNDIMTIKTKKGGFILYGKVSFVHGYFKNISS